ncbi:hypothetical protein U5817_10065 [Aromatoleum evansii]|uniref:Uncharacterized protein n=1 Tax=Aromatoleum evansii TaxID=59406 RepID=A0ABZ1AR74_AROEV|nr:hypothetical protein U5817_09715 [Aromatoleum evansii]WRL48372.1 hypothetical protein U5817_10065 [Aromatoleum evansii]
MTAALLTQAAVEVLRSPDPDPLLSQIAVEVLRTDPKLARLDQIAVEVLSLNVPEDLTTPIAGETTVSLAGVADLKLGTSLSGDANVAITGTADLWTGTHLSATGRIDVAPRGRLAGAVATPGTGNFFLLF